MELTKTIALEMLSYDNGLLMWKKRISRRSVIGREAGGVRGDGYKAFMLAGKTYMCHRVIFLMHHGYMPKEVDHADLNRGNNRIENLRDATKSQNCGNRLMRSDSANRFKGVNRKSSGNWGSELTCNGRRMYLGTFPTEESAANAYAEAAVRYHGEFARA